MVYGHGQRWRQNGRRHADGQRRRSPADHAMVKACYAIMQAKHHMILTDRAIAGEHKMFKNKVSELDKFFKTAGEKNDPLYQRIKHEINEDWRSGHLVNNRDHFERMIDSNAADLKNKKLNKNKLEDFYKQGADWARNSFGKKLTNRDLAEARDIIFRQAAEHTTPAASQNTHARVPPQNQPTRAGLTPTEFLAQRGATVSRPTIPRDTPNNRPTSATALQQNPARSSTSAGTRVNTQISAEANAKKTLAEAAKTQAEQANRSQSPKPPQGAQSAAKTRADPPLTGTATRPTPAPRPQKVPTQKPTSKILAPRGATPVPQATEPRDTPMTVDTPSKKRAAPNSPEVSPSNEQSKNGKKAHFDKPSPSPSSPPRTSNFETRPTTTPRKNSPNFEKSPAQNSQKDLPPAQHGASTSKIPRDNGSRYRVLSDFRVDDDTFPTLNDSLKQTPAKRNNTPVSKRKRSARKSSPVTPPEVTGETTPKRVAQTHGGTGASPILRTETGSPNGATQADFVDQSGKKAHATSNKITVFPRIEGAKGKMIQDRWQMPLITKNNLIIGDENLQRIEKIDNDDAHIFAYPNLNINNLKLILQERQDKVTAYQRDPVKGPNPGTTPQKVVFNVGLHDREMLKQSIISQLGAIKPLILTQFRNSQIYFCPVAPRGEGPELFNQTIEEFCKKQENWTFLKDISDIFESDPADPEHWTPACAQEVASLIFDRLN